MSSKSYKSAYREYLRHWGDRHHFAAHSHHPWPDCTRAAHLQYWEDSARDLDEKWAPIFENVIFKAKSHIARHLGLTDPQQIAVASNTHEFVARLLSCFDISKPLRILTTDSEFYSATRQMKRYQEISTVQVTAIPTEPFESFNARFANALTAGNYDLVFFSQVFYNSGFVVKDLENLVSQVKNPNTVIVVDGYHAFCAIPVDLSRLENRIFYTAGGYKYAQSGEGAVFLHVPKDCTLRPLNTGWFAHYASLKEGIQGAVKYPPTGDRFAGATYDPSGWYRFNAVMDWWQNEGITLSTIHDHVTGLQKYFLSRIDEIGSQELCLETLLFPYEGDRTGHFLTFKVPQPESLVKALRAHKIIVDYREDRVRFGMGLYHDHSDIDALIDQLKSVDSVC